jgi:hypothetical protein
MSFGVASGRADLERAPDATFEPTLVDLDRRAGELTEDLPEPHLVAIRSDQQRDVRPERDQRMVRQRRAVDRRAER